MIDDGTCNALAYSSGLIPFFILNIKKVQYINYRVIYQILLQIFQKMEKHFIIRIFIKLNIRNKENYDSFQDTYNKMLFNQINMINLSSPSFNMKLNIKKKPVLSNNLKMNLLSLQQYKFYTETYDLLIVHIDEINFIKIEDRIREILFSL